MKVNVFTDGGSRGNPGPAGIGVAVFDSGNQPLQEYGEFIGTATNNVAEYKAVIKGLELARGLGATQVEIIADSELMVKQMTGIYKVKNENLQPLYQQVRAGMQGFAGVTFRHVKREFNKDADRLANAAMDSRGVVGRSFGAEKPAQEPEVPKQELVAQGQQRTLTKVQLARGARLTAQNEGEAAVYVLRGKVRYLIGERTIILGQEQGYIIPPGVEYSLEAVEASMVLCTK